MRDAGRGCLPDPARKAHWMAMTSNPTGDGFKRGFDQLPPTAYEPDPALTGYPPPQSAPQTEQPPLGSGATVSQHLDSRTDTRPRTRHPPAISAAQARQRAA